MGIVSRGISLPYSEVGGPKPEMDWSGSFVNNGNICLMMAKGITRITVAKSHDISFYDCIVQ